MTHLAGELDLPLKVNLKLKMAQDQAEYFPITLDGMLPDIGLFLMIFLYS